MTKILAFDSMYIVNPIRNLYIGLIDKLLNEKKTKNNSLILYRLDKNNIFINDRRNISGSNIGANKDYIDTLAIKFYKKMEKSGSCDNLTIKNIQLYKLYTRQVKLKLIGVLTCAHIIKNFSNNKKQKLEIITDKQTASIMKETLLFLNYEPTNIKWNVNSLLTMCITINSLIMRSLALIKMLTSPSDLPNDYFYRHIDSNLPTVMITMPKRRPEDFFATYIKKFGSKFNIILYSLGFMGETPNNYKRIRIKKKIGVLRGSFGIKNLCWNADSYIADILLIFKKHSNLNRSIDVVNSIYCIKIDAHITRLQTNVVDNYLAIEARKRGVFILGDIMEEVFYCDSAICSSKSENTEQLKLALANPSKVRYKGSNSLINYRLKSFSNKQDYYLHELLEIDQQKKIIFYASDPSKDESQRYLTEKFLINYFSQLKDFIFIIKTHPQDNGKITNYVYLHSKKPSNVILIGDITQKSKIISKNFLLFDGFDFNAALSSCNGFLTFSSSSILQALILGVKTGIVDKFGSGYYDYLVKYKATMLINDQESLQYFLDNKKLELTVDTLSYCGLNNNDEEFNVSEHLLQCLKEADLSDEIVYHGS